MYDRERLDNWPAPFMAQCSYRALHSLLVDALFDAPRELRHQVIDCAGGLSSGHFIVAIAEGRMKVDVRIDDDVPYIWLSYAADGAMRPILACNGAALGADPELLMREQVARLEDALREIVREA